MGTGSGRRILGASLFIGALVLAAGIGLSMTTDSARGSSRPAGALQLAGSETVRPFAAACAEAFMSRYPESDVVVQGGGSGDGMAALLHGMVDVGMISREPSARERDYAQAQGITLSLIDLALDGVTIIVHRQNPIADLDLVQLAQLYSGRIRNWRELGGADAAVAPLARIEGSGTAILFAERVLHGNAYGESVRRLPTSEEIVAAVADRPEAIGYSSLNALSVAGDGIRVVALRPEPRAAPVAPTADTIRSGRYPLSRTLHFVTAETPSGTVKPFLDFCTAASAHALVERAGFVPMKPASP